MRATKSYVVTYPLPLGVELRQAVVLSEKLEELVTLVIGTTERRATV